MPTEATVDLIINNAVALANNQTALASAAAQSTISASQGYVGPITTNAVYNIEAVEPISPEVDNATITYEAQRDKLIRLLSDELASFYITYYPLASDAFDEATNWLVNAITVGGTGISPTVEDQIWQRGRDRIIADGLRVENQTLDGFASRGFSLPPGALAASLQAVRFEQLAKTQEFSRDTAIRQAEMEIENLRFAVEKAIDSRMRAMAAASDYIRALMTGPDTAARVASLNADAQARMLGATADLYRARLSRDEIAMRIPLANASNGVQAAGITVDGFYKGIDARVRASAAAADVYGRTASAALSSLTSVASTTIASFA